MLPHRKLLTSNILICMAIAMLMSFLVQTPLLNGTLLFLTRVLISIQFALTDNRASFAPTPASLSLDLAVVLACAAIWTYLKSPAGRIVVTLLFGLLLVPIALFLFARFNFLSISLLIVAGVAVGQALDAAQGSFSSRFRRKIVEEKHDAEYNILRHLNHNVKPGLLMARSPITAVSSFLESRDLLDESLARRLDGSNETVREALDQALLSLEHINEILESTRKLVTHEIRREDFVEIDLCGLFEREIVPLYAARMTIRVECDSNIRVRLHRQSFIEAILNLVRNAEVHGFQGDCSTAELSFRVSELRSRIVIDYTNNGRPFPANLSEKDFLTFGRKSGDSPGEGLGGAWVGKVIAAHNGTFEIVRDQHPLHFRIMLPKRGI